ncbi:MAG: archaeosortase/exosortase family protein [Verrucomicrobiia bacterium]
MLTEVQDQPGSACQEHGGKRSLWIAGFSLLPLAYIWLALINQLQVEWSNNEQYSYGWAVPFLALGLLYMRVGNVERGGPGSAVREQAVAGQRWSGWQEWWLVVLFAVCSIFFLPARVIHEAVPLFRPAHWLLGFVTVGLTLVTCWILRGPDWTRRASFAICFILVAIPWLNPWERFMIQGLARIDAALSVELVGLFSVPAVLHGKVIEVRYLGWSA